jgi:tRNA(Ile)-lysidine synthase
MASSRKPRRAEVEAAARRALLDFRGKRVLVGLSGGVDSVVLLHALSRLMPVRAVHVHHGLSPNADAWAKFCAGLCKRLGVPLTARKVRVLKSGQGLEAAAREARHAAFRKLPFDVLALAHQLDDQAETVLMNLLRGAGVRGASGMPRETRLTGKRLARPLLDVPREAITAYARHHRLDWIDDESNASDALTRNFIRLRIAPLLSQRYPRWREALARAAGHFARKSLDERTLLREFLAARGMKAPSEAKLVEMLRQLGAGGAATRIEHDGATLRLYRGRVFVDKQRPVKDFAAMQWRGERKLALPELGGELVFRSGQGIALQYRPLEVRLRSGGERLQPHPRRPRRTLKNLFQEAGVPSWQRDRLPLLFFGDELVWAAGLGVDVRFQGRGVVPQWKERS